MEDPDDDGELMSREDSIRAAMRDATPTLELEDTAFTFEHLPAGTSTWVAGPGNPGDIAKVTVNYTWSFMTPLIAAFFDGGEIDLVVESAMKNESRFE
jgi:hypothetical protein